MMGGLQPPPSSKKRRGLTLPVPVLLRLVAVIGVICSWGWREGFHLIVVMSCGAGLVLDVESCDPVVRCPGCGVIATGHGRIVVEVC